MPGQTKNETEFDQNHILGKTATGNPMIVKLLVLGKHHNR